MEDDVTDVMFRVSKSKADGLDVFALFPGHAGSMDLWTCSSYQHVGQHCDADIRLCMESSRPATPEEYASLKRELESAPYKYNLRIVKRATLAHSIARMTQCTK